MKNKADCTPEEWEKRLKYHRERDRKRRESPEYRERERERDRKSRKDPERRERERERDRKRRESPEYREKHRRVLRKSRTGWSHEKVLQALEAQNGKCMICLREITYNKASADHCHKTDLPRSLLCASCNTRQGIIDETNPVTKAINDLHRTYRDFWAQEQAKAVS